MAKDTSDPPHLVLKHIDLTTIFLGRESGQRYISTFIDSHLVSRPLSATCLSRTQDFGRPCRESSYYIMLNILRAVGGISHGRDADPMFTLGQVVEMLGRRDFTDGVRMCGLRMCVECKRDLEECVERARKDVWGMVPGWFGLKGWKMNEGEGEEGGKKKI